MHKDFAAYLVDPLTKEPLQLVVTSSRGDIVETGFLKSTSAQYPVLRGIPRFAGDHGSYAESFGYQWGKWSRLQFESSNVIGPMAGHTWTMWERITGLRGELPGALVVDIGCGAGRFIEVARRKGAKIIGIDFSAAVDVAADNFRDDPDVCICQADALHLPIKKGAADGAYAIGVLHHTPDPSRGVEEVARVVKPGGWCALSVYGKGGYYDFPTVQMWRRLFKSVWPMLKHYPPLLYSYLTVYGFRPIARVPLLGKVIKAFFPFVTLPDIRWSLLDTFDSVTPSYQSAHECYEVFQWLKRCGFVNIEPSDWGFTSFRATKPNRDVA